MINGMDFKTDSGLGMPDCIYFRKDGAPVLWSSAAVGQMNPQRYAIDWLASRCLQCSIGCDWGIGKNSRTASRTMTDRQTMRTSKVPVVMRSVLQDDPEQVSIRFFFILSL